MMHVITVPAKRSDKHSDKLKIKGNKFKSDAYNQCQPNNDMRFLLTGVTIETNEDQ